MRHLFSHEGDTAVSALLAQSPLLAFDFDGTLAPIVARPDDARISTPVATRLAQLARRLPVAIVTGRARDDVRRRLPFEPRFIVGNHGAEGPDDAATYHHARVLEPLRAHLALHSGLLEEAGVSIEDKGASIALHFRLARNREAAQATIDRVLDTFEGDWVRFDGKMVVNLASATAPDKGQAVRDLVERSGAGSAFFAGDDVNDEPVFRIAPPHWVTVRVGPLPSAGTAAQFILDGPQEMAVLLQRMLKVLETVN